MAVLPVATSYKSQQGLDSWPSASPVAASQEGPVPLRRTVPWRAVTVPNTEGAWLSAPAKHKSPRPRCQRRLASGSLRGGPPGLGEERPAMSSCEAGAGGGRPRADCQNPLVARRGVHASRYLVKASISSHLPTPCPVGSSGRQALMHHVLLRCGTTQNLASGWCTVVSNNSVHRVQDCRAASGS